MNSPQERPERFKLHANFHGYSLISDPDGEYMRVADHETRIQEVEGHVGAEAVSLSERLEVAEAAIQERDRLLSLEVSRAEHAERHIDIAKADLAERDREIERLAAKVDEQRRYIDLLVKAGKGSEDYAERVRAGVLAEINRGDDSSLAFRLEEFIAAVALPQPVRGDKDDC